MLENTNDEIEEIKILNRLLAAQSTLQVFDKAVNLGDFVVGTIQSVPGVNYVELTLRTEVIALDHAENSENQDFYSLISELSNNFIPPVIELPENNILISLKTFKTTFGLLKITIRDSYLFKKYEPAIRNLLNVCALHLENNMQAKIAARYKGHLEELVEERTSELQEEIQQRIEKEERLRESEERFRNLVENVDDIIYTADRCGKLIYISPTWKKWMGYQPEEVIGTSFKRYVHPDDLNRCMEYFLQIATLKKQQAAIEYRIIKSDGSVRWQANNASAYMDKTGEVTHIFGIARDITLRKEAEQKLRSHMDDLKSSLESKDKYFSVLAHDLRSPFHIFLNLSELLSEEIDHLSRDEITKLSKQLNIALRKQFELLTDLLDWSGIESDQLAFCPVPTLFYEEVMKVFDSVSTLAQAKNIQLICEISGDLEVYADPKILRTLLRNLVSNSIKFTNEGGLIKVSALKKEGQIEVIVVDNGVGMNSTVVNELFTPDFYFTTPGTGNEKGTGLGLRFCKQAVDKHNGTIWAESILGQGSSFHFTLPEQEKTVE